MPGHCCFLPLGSNQLTIQLWHSELRVYIESGTWEPWGRNNPLFLLSLQQCPQQWELQLDFGKVTATMQATNYPAMRYLSTKTRTYPTQQSWLVLKNPRPFFSLILRTWIYIGCRVTLRLHPFIVMKWVHVNNNQLFPSLLLTYLTKF